MAKDGSSRRSFLQGGLAAGTGAGALVALGAPALAHAETSVGRTTFSHFHVPAIGQDRALGLLQQEPQAGRRGGVGRLRHDRDRDAPRERRRRADGEGRSRRRVDLLLGRQAQRRRPARRRADGRVAVRARRRRGAGRAHLHGPGRGEGRGAGRHPRGAHPRRAPAAVREPEVRGQDLRQQRRGLVGLPLQGSPRGSEAARGDHHLRGRRHRRARLGQGPLQLPLDAADRSVRRRCTRPSTTPASPSTTARSRRSGASSRTCAFRSARTSARWASRPRRRSIVDSIPPSYTGGNIDNWRIGKGATMYYPVAVPGALLSVGDPHASQGDSELCGTAIECSLTGTFQLILHKQGVAQGDAAAGARLPAARDRDRVRRARLQLTRTTWPSSAPRRSRRSTPSRRPISRCATRSARCAGS